MSNAFGREDFWVPSFSLSLELGFAGCDERVAAALSAFWMCPGVEGPWTEPGDIGNPERHGLASGCDARQAPYGLLTTKAATPPMPFVLHCIREECARPSEPDPTSSGVEIQFGIQTQEPSDWLTLDIPVRALAARWPVDNSWSVATQPWLVQFCRALADVAGHVHGHAPLLGGVIGEEASGCWRVPTPHRAGEAEQGYPPLAVLTAQAIEERGGFVVTRQLWQQLAPCAEPVVLPSGLLYALPLPTAQLSGA